MRITRREFLLQTSKLGLGALMGVGAASAASQVGRQGASPAKERVAAVQFHPKLGDVDANLEKAGRLVREAFSKGARWVVLPEFFTSGFAMHKAMMDAHRPLAGQPSQFLSDLAKAGNGYVGGSYLAKSRDDIFNTFVLAGPSGETFSHDKDFPSTALESSFYAGGEDDVYVQKLKADGVTTKAEVIPRRPGNNVDGLFSLGGINVGAACCWELARYRTAKRLRGKINLLLAASCWPHADPELGWPGRTRDDIAGTRANQKLLIENAPRRQARLLGVPVVHANFTGLNPGFSSNTFEQAATTSFFGLSQIVDAHGEIVARLGTEEGVLVGDVEISHANPQEEIPDEFWIPEMPQRGRRNWSITGAAGRDFYLTVTRPHIRRSS